METLHQNYAFGKPKEQVDIDGRLSASTTVAHRQSPDAPVGQQFLKSPDPEKP